MIPATLWLIGCGNMGGAMLRRWIDSGAVDPAGVTVIDPGTPSGPNGVRVVAAQPGTGVPDAVLLAVKPQSLDKVAPHFGALGRVPLLLSILAGVDEPTLHSRIAADSIVRVMPNLPVAIGKGVVALTSASAGPTARDSASALMAPLGLVEWIDDAALFDAVTALSGCGPGFVYRFVDALADAGAGLGLPLDQARRLAVATVEGAALLAAGSDVPPAILADRVASPGGSTRAGLDVLDADDALRRLLAATLAASRDRNAAMAAEART